MKIKAKTCRVCKEDYQPRVSLQVCCSLPCALKQSTDKRLSRERVLVNRAEKAARAVLRKDKARIKTRSQHLKEAQAVYNKWIRLRDDLLPCISCQRHHNGQYHAGHYRSVGAAPELRFDEDNCHKQCAPCNNHLSGNIADYRINLVKKIGQAKVDGIEGPHSPCKYTIEEIKGIKSAYKDKIKSITSTSSPDEKPPIP